MELFLTLALFIISATLTLVIYFKQKKTSISKDRFDRFEKEFPDKIKKIFKNVYLDGLPEIKEIKKKKVLLESTDLMGKGQFKDAKDNLKGYIGEFSLTESERAAVINLIGLCYLYSGKLDESIRHFEEVKLIGERIKDHQIQGIGSFNIGYANVKKGDYDRARDGYLSAIKHYANSQSFYDLALAMSNLGVVFSRRGDFKRAKEIYEKSLNLAERNNDVYLQAINLQNLGCLYNENNQKKEAQSHHEKALEIFQSLNDVLDFARQLRLLGDVYINSEPEKAFDHYLQAKNIIEQTDSIEEKAAILASIAEYYLEKEEYDEAENYYLQALPLIRKVKHKYKMAVFCANFGVVYVKTMKLQEALELFEESYTLFKDMNMISQAIESLISLGRTYLLLEQDEPALKCFNNAIINSEGIDYIEGIAKSHYYSGLVKYFKFNDSELALKELTIADENFKKLNILIDERKLTEELIEKIKFNRES